MLVFITSPLKKKKLIAIYIIFYKYQGKKDPTENCLLRFTAPVNLLMYALK